MLRLSTMVRVAVLVLATASVVAASPAPRVLAAPAAFDICVGPPAADQVILYASAGFSGNCSVRTIGEYYHSWAFELGNDSLSSVWVGDAVHVLLCREANYGGYCEWLATSDGALSDNAVGNDTVSSIRVRPLTDFSKPAACPPGAFQVSFYMDAWFGGSCSTITVTGKKLIPHSDGLSLPNDSISSFRAGKGIASVQLCRDAEYSATGGGCVTFDAATTDLVYGVPALSTYYINDQTSSAILKAKTLLLPPIGPIVGP